MRVRWPFIATLVGVAIWGVSAMRANARRQTEVLAVTTCPWRGEPVTRINANLSAEEAAHVTAHESIHAQQCRLLGPFQYRLRNLTSKLALEAPAYCAGAKVHLAFGMDTIATRTRLVDDAVEALRGTADSASIVDALHDACPGIFYRKPSSASRRISA
jgi:hypothetical protein